MSGKKGGDGSTEVTQPETGAPSEGTRLASTTRAPPKGDDEALANTLTRSNPENVSLDGTPGSELHRYELRGELGRGGQSVVRRAWDVRLEREVAIKELRHDSNEAARDRFWREARITARLEHPNIVPVYEIGRREDGTLYCVQRLVRAEGKDGQTRTLRAALQAARTLDERLRLLPRFLDVCHGVAYAHAQGILHRDLKPENVMLGQFGETVILDWGLARVVGDGQPIASVFGKGASTLAGVAYGTPGYMSPEQARGETVAIDARADVWSLGVMLFELLTGRLPFSGESAIDVIGKVLHDPIPNARDLEPYAPPELAAVARRAMERQPRDRYPTAEALAEEVIAWQSGRRVSVYRYSAFESAALFVQRHRTAAGAALAVLLSLAVFGGVTWVQLKAARRANAHALVEKARTADRALRWNEAALYYAAARVYDDNPETRWGVRTRGNRKVPPPIALAGQREGVKAVAFSPDGKLLAAGSVGGTVRLFRAGDGALVGTLAAHVGDATCLAWSADGLRLATGGTDGKAWLWDVARLERLRQLGASVDPINRVALSVDGQWAALAYEAGKVEVLSLTGTERQEMIPTEQHKRHPVYGLALDPARPQLALATWSGLLEIRALDGALLQRLPGVAPMLLDVQYGPDGKSLALAGSDRAVRWYTLDARGLVVADSVRLLDGHRAKVYGISFARDGQWLASASTDQTVRLWGSAGRPQVGRSLGGLGELEALALAPDGRSFAAGGQTAPAALYPLPEDDAVVRDTGDRFEGLQSGPGHAFYGFVARQGPMFFEGAARAPLERAQEPGANNRELALARSGAAVAWPCPEESLCWADVPRLEKVGKLRYPFSEATRAANAARIQAVGMAPDASWVAAGDRGGELRLWSLPDGVQRHMLVGHRDAVFALDASPDGKLLASGAYDTTVRLWDPATGALLATLAGHTHGVRRVRFSPDGKTLASTGWDRTVRLWDVATRAPLRICRGHEDHAFGLDWAPDGSWLASAARDGTVRIWDPETCRLAATVVTDETHVYGLAVWGDGKGFSYSGASVHAFTFQPLLSPTEQLREVEERTGLVLDEEHLVAVPRASRPR